MRGVGSLGEGLRGAALAWVQGLAYFWGLAQTGSEGPAMGPTWGSAWGPTGPRSGLHGALVGPGNWTHGELCLSLGLGSL